MLVTNIKVFKVCKKIKRECTPCELVRKIQMNIEEEFKIKELWQSYDKRRIGMKRTRRVWLRNEVISMKD